MTLYKSEDYKHIRHQKNIGDETGKGKGGVITSALDKLIKFLTKKNEENFIKKVNKIRETASEEAIIKRAETTILNVLSDSAKIYKHSKLSEPMKRILKIEILLENQEVKKKIYSSLFFLIQDDDVDILLQKALHNVLKTLPILPKLKRDLSVGFVCAVYRKQVNTVDEEKQRALAKELASFLHTIHNSSEYEVCIECKKAYIVPPKIKRAEEILKEVERSFSKEVDRTKITYSENGQIKSVKINPMRSRVFKKTLEQELKNLEKNAISNKKNHA